MLLLQKLPAKSVINAEKVVRSYYRIVADAALYGIASLSMFHQAPKRLFAHKLGFPFASPGIATPPEPANTSPALAVSRRATILQPSEQALIRRGRNES